MSTLLETLLSTDQRHDAEAADIAAQHSTVFCVRRDEWQARIGGTVLPTIWNSRGAALAGAQVESRRNARRQA